MKKLLTIALALLMICALATNVSAASKFEAAKGTPVVDGIKDEAYVCAAMPANFEADPAAATGMAYACWDADFLYIFIDVTDAKVLPAADVTGIWSCDCAEIYVNFAGENGLIADINAAQYSFGPSFDNGANADAINGFAGGGLHRTENAANAKGAYQYTDNGWTVEVAIPWGADYKPADNASFPFCIGINDEADGDASTREFQTFTGADQSNAWQEATDSWDTLTLTTNEFIPVIEVEEEAAPADAADVAAAPAAATTAAQTMDMSVVLGLAALAISGGAVLGLKKRK